MAEEIVKVTGLPKVESLKDEDSVLLIREDGEEQKCYQVKGKQFNGKSAYDVAKEQGFTGTYEEWQAQVKQVADFDISFDAESGCIIIEK